LIKRNTVLYIIDLFLLILICISLITGLIKFPGLLRNIGIEYLTIPFHLVSIIHDWSGLFMGILIFIHLILHWLWMVQMTKKIISRRN
jgi:hypothetical protein